MSTLSQPPGSEIPSTGKMSSTDLMSDPVAALYNFLELREKYLVGKLSLPEYLREVGLPDNLGEAPGLLFHDQGFYRNVYLFTKARAPQEYINRKLTTIDMIAISRKDLMLLDRKFARAGVTDITWAKPNRTYETQPTSNGATNPESSPGS